MIPARYDILDRYKGDTSKAIQFQLLDGVTPVSLVGVSILIQFKRGSSKNAASLELTTTDGVTITNAAQGIFEIDEILELPLNAGTYIYDVQITFADGTIETPIYGQMKVIQDISYGNN